MPSKKPSLRAVSRKLTERPVVPSSNDPREELRRIVLQHKAITRASVALDNMSRNKTNLETGEVMKCRLPEDVMVDLQETAKRQGLRANKLETAMLRELRKVPIYQVFLGDVFGCGPVVAAYLVAEIDIHKAVKPSNLRRFCGLAVIDGKLERRQRGAKNAYSSEMRTRVWQMCMAMRKNGARYTGTTKYLQVWDNWIVRKQSAQQENVSLAEEHARGPNEPSRLERVIECDCKTHHERAIIADVTREQERAARSDETKKPKRKLNKNQGWVKAADLFLTDLYIVWRTLEGLPVWPSYLDGVLRGVAHGSGEPVVNQPTMLTLDEALEIVGHTGKVGLPQAAE